MLKFVWVKLLICKNGRQICQAQFMRNFLFKWHLFICNLFIISELRLENDFLLIVVFKRKSVLLSKVRVRKLTITDCELLIFFNFSGRLKHYVTLIFNFIMVACKDTVWLRTVINIVKERKYHEDCIWIWSVLIGHIVENKISCAHNCESPAPLFKTDRGINLIFVFWAFKFTCILHVGWLRVFN